MSLFRLTFAGQIKKVEFREAGGKPLAEVSLCKKTSRKGEEDAFTWIRATIWQPAEFQIPKLTKGAFIAGCGEMSARSYEGKYGKAFSIEVRCSSFDVEVSDGQPSEAPRHAAPQRPIKPDHAKAAGGDINDEPPF